MNHDRYHLTLVHLFIRSLVWVSIILCSVRCVPLAVSVLYLALSPFVVISYLADLI